MEEKLKHLVNLKGTPNNEALEIINLAKNIIGKKNETTYLRFLIVLQAKISGRDVPRMIEAESDKELQSILSDLFNTFETEYPEE